MDNEQVFGDIDNKEFYREDIKKAIKIIALSIFSAGIITLLLYFIPFK